MYRIPKSASQSIESSEKISLLSFYEVILSFL